MPSARPFATPRPLPHPRLTGLSPLAATRREYAVADGTGPRICGASKKKTPAARAAAMSLNHQARRHTPRLTPRSSPPSHTLSGPSTPPCSKPDHDLRHLHAAVSCVGEWDGAKGRAFRVFSEGPAPHTRARVLGGAAPLLACLLSSRGAAHSPPPPHTLHDRYGGATRRDLWVGEDWEAAGLRG